MRDNFMSDFLAVSRSPPNDVAVLFGPFRLYPLERRLECSGVAYRLGSRALDLLIALVEKPGEVVENRTLIARAWRNIVVDHSNLRVNIAALRKALNDGDSGTQYVRTVPGIGYCFVARLTLEQSPLERLTSPSRGNFALFPARTGTRNFLGDSQRLRDHIERHRLVSVVGSGGVGKSAITRATISKLPSSAELQCCVVDLTESKNGCDVLSAFAESIGWDSQGADGCEAEQIIRHVATRRTLIVLDNCEHVISPVATLVSQILASTSEAHVIVTSRESLRIRGEYVFRVMPLEVPPNCPVMAAEEARCFTAFNLFASSAEAVGCALELTPHNILHIAKICRSLGGTPLAIEIAAARVPAFGLVGVLGMLDNVSRLQWQGHRDAPARQRSMEASLAWSYSLLSERERTVFRRFAVFDQPLSLNVVMSNLADRATDVPDAIDAVEGLVEKHMLNMVTGVDGLPCYFMSETERLFAQMRLWENDLETHSVSIFPHTSTRIQRKE